MDETPSRLAPKIKAPTFNFVANEGARVPSFETMDRLGSAVAAKFTRGSRRTRCTTPGSTWASHLVNAPGRLVELGIEAVNIGARLARFAANGLSSAALRAAGGRPAFQRPRLEAARRAVAAGLFLAQEDVVGKRNARGTAA